ncbi:hypothetical protein MIND_00799800 [Mycena indigotica]|uniref:Uncharacterized protein n=1 Tax=Mycena indigotica TaxID=2126181 RepID=A0A8H6VYJ1_9AGAR|nr:uncharacterized protein MIND_00799800 [Mycena indigotica]KAF7298532.1 hypothetical protein MIND_00799800 [Mycena indigotica]
MLLFLTMLAMIPQPALPSSSPATSGSDLACDNHRSLYTIVWGCFTTLFACIWVSAHPNVPPPAPPSPRKDATLGAHLKSYLIDGTIGLWRRLKLVLVAFIAPELIVGFAGRQFETARYFSTTQAFDISLTHGFFISMGGFIDAEKHPIVDSRHVEQHILQIREISEQDICNRSQGDAFSKTVALLQTSWFVVQCLARFQQNLTVTELEVATLAFAVVNAFSWLLWWKKPLDVRAPIVLGLTVGKVARDPALEQIQPAGNEQHLRRHRPLRERFYSLFGNSLSSQNYFYEDAVPTFYFASGWDDHERYTPAISLLVALIFGAVHCAAWRSHFLTVEELWLWRGATLVLCVVPIPPLFAHLWATLGGTGPLSHRVLPLYVVGAAYYVPTRIILVLLPLLALRHAPDAAYLEVNWNRYFPHIYS